MIVPDDVRKCVVFLGYQLASGEMRLAGSAFFVGRNVSEDKASEVFLVTAKHVVDGIRKLGLTELFIRVNTKAGQSSWAKCQSTDWLFHPSDSTIDVALLRAGIPADLDHLVLPITMCATPQTLKENAVGLGDEVFVVGLFRHHHGAQRNIPIVRVGNLAAMAEEKVVTRDFGLIDAYLVEARSIGGLSGSPVFLNLGVVRYIEGQVKHAQGGPIFYLFGLVHGHYDVQASAVDTAESDVNNSLHADRVNTGIAIVVPVQKIKEVIDLHAKTGG